MEAARYFKTWIKFYQNTRHHIQEDRTIFHIKDVSENNAEDKIQISEQ
jgi:hypothetical protein